jgi:hypothetical protein
MLIQTRRPEFGGRRKTDDYYSTVLSIIAVLRPHSTLRVICDHLNNQNFTTPGNLPWNRERLSSFLKTHETN